MSFGGDHAKKVILKVGTHVFPLRECAEYMPCFSGILKPMLVTPCYFHHRMVGVKPRISYHSVEKNGVGGAFRSN